VAQTAPASAVADGLAGAFRSDATPPFAQMLAQLFERSPAPQRSNILNTLIGVLEQAFKHHANGCLRPS